MSLRVSSSDRFRINTSIATSLRDLEPLRPLRSRWPSTYLLKELMLAAVAFVYGELEESQKEIEYAEGIVEVQSESLAGRGGFRRPLTGMSFSTSCG